MGDVSRLCMANSFKANASLLNKGTLASKCIKLRLSFINVRLTIASTAIANSSLLILAKKPNRPKLMPSMGIFLSRTSVTASSMVPSPPRLIKHSKSLVKSVDAENGVRLFSKCCGNAY